MKTKLGVVLCSFFLMPALLLAQDQTHDGFFLNLSYGSGSGSATAEGDDGSTDYSGSGNIFLLKIGGSINPNWSIHYNHGAIGVEADVPADLKEAGVNKITYGVDSQGIGATYYFVSSNPYLSNLYISPEYRFGVDAVFQAEIPIIAGISGTYEEHYSGSGFGFTVGKEWWVSPNWGLGLALFYHSDSLDGDKSVGTLGDESNLDGTAKVSHFGFLFSATFN